MHEISLEINKAGAQWYFCVNITISRFYACKNIPSKYMMQNQTALQRYMDKLITRLIGFNIPFSVMIEQLDIRKKWAHKQKLWTIHLTLEKKSTEKQITAPYNYPKLHIWKWDLRKREQESTRIISALGILRQENHKFKGNLS